MGVISAAPVRQRIVQSKATCLLVLTLAGWPALVLLWVILAYGVNVPVMDEWFPTIAGLHIKAHQSTLTLSDFLAQHNEHRMIVPRVILFVLERLTRFNKVVEMVASWVLACFMSLGLLRVILHTSQPVLLEQSQHLSWSRIALIWLICNLFVFSPSGWENWLMGFGFSNVLPTVMFVAIVVVAISSARFWAKVTGAIVLAMAAMWSTGNGLLAWPLAGVLLSWSGSRREFKAKSPVLLVLLGACGVNLLVYALTHVDPPPSSGEQLHAKSLGQLIQHNLVFMGNATTFALNMPWISFAAITGIVYFVMLLGSFAYFLYVWLRCRDHDVAWWILIWLSLSGVSYFNGFIASYHRAALGAEQAASSRYLIHSLFLPIALVNLVPIICADIASRFAAAESGGGKGRVHGMLPLVRQAPVFLGGVMLFLAVVTLSPGIHRSEEEFRNRRHAKATLLLANVIEDVDRFRRLVSHDPLQTVVMARALNQFGYIHPPLISTSNAASITSPTHSQVRGRLEKYWQSGFDRVSISGWACAPGSWRAADAVFLSYDDENGIPIIFKLVMPVQDRSDLADREGVPELVHAGWQLDLPYAQFPPNRGAIRIRAWVLDVDTARAVKVDGEAILSLRG